MYDFKQDYLNDIIKPIEEEVNRLRRLKVKKRFLWTKYDEKKLEEKELLLLQKYEKLGSMLDDFDYENIEVTK